MKFAEVGFVNQCEPSMLVMHNKFNSVVTRYILTAFLLSISVRQSLDYIKQPTQTFHDVEEIMVGGFV